MVSRTCCVHVLVSIGYRICSCRCSLNSLLKELCMLNGTMYLTVVCYCFSCIDIYRARNMSILTQRPRWWCIRKISSVH